MHAHCFQKALANLKEIFADLSIIDEELEVSYMYYNETKLVFVNLRVS